MITYPFGKETYRLKRMLVKMLIGKIITNVNTLLVGHFPLQQWKLASHHLWFISDLFMAGSCLGKLNINVITLKNLFLCTQSRIFSYSCLLYHITLFKFLLSHYLECEEEKRSLFFLFTVVSMPFNTFWHQ